MSRKASFLFGLIVNQYNKIRYGIKIEKYTSLRGKVYFYSTRKGSIRIGEGCIINSGVPFNLIGGDHITILRTEETGTITVGNNVGISNSAIVSFSEIRIEDDVMIGGDCKILDTDFHSTLYIDRIKDKGVKTSPITICKGAFIGCSSIILKGVRIGEYSVIGAGSVVTTSIPDREVWAGNPAHFIKKIEE